MGLNDYLSAQFGHPTGLSGRLVTLVMNRQNRPLYEATAQLLSLSDDDRVLDIGCGNGVVLGLLASRSQASFTGIDVSPSMVAASASRNGEFIRQGRMAVFHEDAACLSAPDGSFTKAYTINTVYFWEDVAKTMAEIRRVLRPGGLFVNVLYTNETLARFAHTKTGYKHHEPSVLIESAENTGFEASIVPLLDGSAYAVECRAKPVTI
ncbi:MAG: class I SAM-dependent methyltransferase [Propionibacteriaceae bacterium]|nr:class I SAM-dependent methyltransferase [Propionibacteriaceae bacterium]